MVSGNSSMVGEMKMFGSTCIKIDLDCMRRRRGPDSVSGVTGFVRGCVVERSLPSRLEAQQVRFYPGEVLR